MKDYLEKRREELRKEQGFTLMEMLIVVAIIAVLIAIAIPVFTSQLESARDATTCANLRSAYAEATVAALEPNKANWPASVDKDNSDADAGKYIVKEVVIESSDDSYGEGETQLPFTFEANGKIKAPDTKKVTVTFTIPKTGNAKPTAKVE